MDIPPFSLAFIRWSLALLILLPFAIPVMVKNRQLIGDNLKILIVLGILSVATFNTLAYIGLQYTTAVNGTLMQSSMPIMILLISALFLREPASLKQWLGVAVSLLGVTTLITRGQPDQIVQFQINPGDLWILLAMLVWATYSICLRWRPQGLSGFAFFSVTLSVGVIALIPFAVWEMAHSDPINWNQDLYLTLGYLALFPSILAYMFWNYGVARLGAGRAGLFIHLVPLWGMMLSVLFLGEQVHTFHLWGIGLIFIGIYLAVLSGKRQQAG